MTLSNQRPVSRHWYRERNFLRIVFLATVVLFNSGIPASAQQRIEEPSYAEIDSKKCQVDVCTEDDLGSVIFRYYAPERSTTIRLIPPGACSCKRITQARPHNNGTRIFSVEFPDGTSRANVSAVGNMPRFNRTTYQRFLSEAERFEPFPEYSSARDSFSGFNVYREKDSRLPVLWFVSKDQFTFNGEKQPIAFTTGIGVVPSHPSFAVIGDIRVSPNARVGQTFYTDTSTSSEWVARLTKSVPVVESHLFPKTDGGNLPAPSK